MVFADTSEDLILKKYEESLWGNRHGQYLRVDRFSCSDLPEQIKRYERAVKTLFQNSNSNDSGYSNAQGYFARGSTREKPSFLRFPNLSDAAKSELMNIIPASWNGLQAKAKEISPNDWMLLLAIFFRETEGDPFLDERVKDGYSLSNVVDEKRSKGGAGLLQMTAQGFDDYERYMQFVKENPPPADVPPKVSKRYKNQITTAEEFLETPYNPVLSLWFGQKEISANPSEALMKWGIELNSLGAVNRASILGAIYNGGYGPVRCALERAKIWNSNSERGNSNVSDWHTLRKFLILDGPIAKESGFSEDLINRLKHACDVVEAQNESSDNKNKTSCKCLDSSLGFAKAEIVASYGDHMGKIINCFVENPYLNEKPNLNNRKHSVIR